MSDVKISNIKVEKRSINKRALNKFVQMMKKHGTADPLGLLPGPCHTVSFDLTNTNSSMANAIRRVLIEELPCTCLQFDAESLETDDEFILADVLQKNIELIPIAQHGDTKITLSLDKYNNTNDIIEVRASDLTVSKSVPISDVIPNGNIAIMDLRPGKYVKINKLTIITGIAKTDAGKFTLLDNVKYKINNVTPFKNTGIRSVEYNPTDFGIEFTTSGNITPKQVLNKLNNVLTGKLKTAHDLITAYTTAKHTDYYAVDGLEVTILNEITTYKFFDEYITLSNMLGHQCYLLDKSVLFCAPGIARLDSNIAIIRLKHPDATKLMLSAIDKCRDQIKVIIDAVLKKCN